MQLNPPSTAIFQINDSLKIKNSDKALLFKNDVSISQAIATDTNYVIIPGGTNEQRPLNPPNGLMRYNTIFHSFEFFNNNSWIFIPTSYSVLLDITPKTLPNTNDTATVTGQDMIPGMIFEFVGFTNVSYLVTNYSYVDASTVIIYRQANMSSNEEPYTLRVTLPNGPMYELKDMVKVGP